MRIAGVVIVWIILIGGVYSYMSYQDAGRAAAGLSQEVQHEQSFCSVEITSTFSVEKDPFALDLDDGSENAFSLKLGNRIILQTSDKIEAGIPFNTGKIENINEGLNELYIEASPPVDNISKHNAVRVNVYQGDYLLADKTLWGSPGEKIAGTITFELSNEKEEGNHDH